MIRTIKKIIIHHSLTKDSRIVDWQQIRVYHTSYRVDGKIVSKEEYELRLKNKNGKIFEPAWEDIGYHFGIEIINNIPEVLVGRGLNKVGAHTRGENVESIGICFVGNFDIIEPPQEVLDIALDRIIIPLCEIFELSAKDIYGHRDFCPYKTCPGKLFDLERIKEPIRKL